MNSNFSRFLLVTSLAGLCACSSGDDATLSPELEMEALPIAAELAAADSAASLSLDEQIAIIDARIEATNTRDWDTWQALHTPGATRTAPDLEQPLRGSAALRAAIETLSGAFPDYHLERQQAFGDGEWLAVKIHTTGTMTGPLTLSDGTELPATGQRIEQDWSALVRFEGDRIAEFNEFYDQLTLLLQLGLISL